MGKVSFARIFILFASVVLWMAALRSTSEWGFSLRAASAASAGAVATEASRRSIPHPWVEDGVPAAAVGHWF